jgi:competence protein ComEC
MGVRKIDCLVLTHPDLDHVGGLRTLSERVRIGRVVVSRLFRNDPEMLKALGESRISPSQVVWIDGVWRASVGRFDLVIAAPAGHAGTEPNEGSLFVRADVGGASLLVTGDANSETEAAMSGVYDWDVDVLKAGHHGSRFSTSTEWLETTSPALVVASCGRGNMYGHPAPAMVDRVRAYGARFMRTDRDGTIVLLPDGDDWRVLPFGAPD